MIRKQFTSCVHAIFFLLLPVVSLAADPNEFLAGTYIEPGTGFQLPYRLFKPTDYDPNKEYPLILFLHGAGERGTNNTSQVNKRIDNLLAHVKMSEYSSFLLAPQSNGDWASWGDYPSIWTRMAMSLLPQVENDFNIDQDRLYVTGLSMGGAGTWDIIWRYPETFAAAVPICGYGDTSKAPLMVDQPIFAFHAADDWTVPVECTRAMVQAIIDAGGDPLYTEYKTGGHQIQYRVYYEQTTYDWMLSQSLNVPEPASLCLALSGVVAIGCFLVRRRLIRKCKRIPLDTV